MHSQKSAHPPNDGILWADGPEYSEEYAVDPATGQPVGYFYDAAAELAKGYVRPLRITVRHRCGAISILVNGQADVFARDPTYHSHVACCQCWRSFPVAEFTWVADGTPVGS